MFLKMQGRRLIERDGMIQPQTQTPYRILAVMPRINAEVPEIAPELAAQLLGQVVQDSGIPVENPTFSTWQEPAHCLANVQSKDLPARTDFAIIGSGITGCGVAKTLLESELLGDKTVTVFDARGLTTGATSRSGGFLLSHVPIFFQEFFGGFGKENAMQIARFCDRTLDNIGELAKSENLEKECQIRNVQTVFNFEDDAGLAKGVESIRLYEECFPEAKGAFTLVSKETAEKVWRSGPRSPVLIHSKYFAN